MHLIVLDDDEAMASFMATVAREQGWVAQTATAAAEFQALIRASPPHAIMLDLQLGASDGIEQLRFLHSQRYAGAIALISGFDVRVLTSAQEIGDSLGLMIAAVVEKPARADRIRDVLTLMERSLAVPAEPLPDAEGTGRQPPPEGETLSAANISHAIDADQMALYLQPIVSAAGNVVKRAEALVRWRHPVLGLIPPDRFVPVAEHDETAIDRLTMWVAETGMAQYRKLAALGSAIQICINISGRSLDSADFPDRMTALLQRMSVPPGAIGLEITESAAMRDLDATTATLTRLRLKGFPVAIDDFGTGHSSLASLRRMPFSAIKIDRSFVGDLQTSSDSLTIVRSVIQLARDMGLVSVAEGVATADTMRMLTDLGIDSLQGYHFSPPLPFDGFVTWLQEWSRSHVTTRA